MFSVLKLKPAFCRICTVTTQPNLKPFNSKISNLMKHGFVEEARKVFDEMPQRNTVTWNAMISGLFRIGHFENALQLYDEMPERDIFSYNTMISGLMKFGDIDGAKNLFNHMTYKDVVTWNSMITGFIQNGFMFEAVTFFNMMPVKDVISSNLVITGLIDMQEIGLAEKFFAEMTERDIASWTIMMSGFISAGRIKKARKCFDCMPMKDVKAWNTIISGYTNKGYFQISMRLFHQMPQKCQQVWNSIVLSIIRHGLINECHAIMVKSPYRDIVSCTNLIIGYFSRNEVVNAMKLFNSMHIVDTTVFNVMIFGLGENDYAEDGMKLFIKMKKGDLFLDEATYTSVLTICSNLPSLDLGKQTHAQVVKSGINCFIPVSNAMITMYSRCGNIDFALLEFFSISNHDVISWNSIICGLAYHGHGEKAVMMFEKMMLKNVKPNKITFVGVLSACSHTGLVEQGKWYFDKMIYEYLIKPTSEHYTCIVDLFSRFGLIYEAVGILKQMIADGTKIPASVWGALLGACRVHKEYEVGKMVGEKMLDLEPLNTGAYMILAEMHLQSGNQKEAANVLVRMREKGVRKQPGCSWIEVNNSGHVFVAGENSHSKFQRIWFLLDLMHKVNFYIQFEG